MHSRSRSHSSRRQEEKSVDENKWVKSSFSNGTGGSNCVEVKTAGGLVYTRHSKLPNHVTAYSKDEWVAFLKGVQAGEFDL
jgi:hypothetical protein